MTHYRFLNMAFLYGLLSQPFLAFFGFQFHILRLLGDTSLLLFPPTHFCFASKNLGSILLSSSSQLPSRLSFPLLHPPTNKGFFFAFPALHVPPTHSCNFLPRIDSLLSFLEFVSFFVFLFSLFT